MKLFEFHLSLGTPFRTGSDSKSASNTQGNKKKTGHAGNNALTDTNSKNEADRISRKRMWSLDTDAHSREHEVNMKL